MAFTARARKRRTEFLAFCRYIRSLYPPTIMQRRTGFTSECQEREVNGVAERFNDSPDVPGTER